MHTENHYFYVLFIYNSFKMLLVIENEVGIRSSIVTILFHSHLCEGLKIQYVKARVHTVRT